MSLSNKKIRIGVFISGSGTNLQAVIDACESGKINGQVVFAAADNPNAKGLQKAEKHSIPHFCVDYGSVIKQFEQNQDEFKLPRDFDIQDSLLKSKFSVADKNNIKFLKTRAAAEAALLEKIKPFDFNIICLAGFMRKLTPYFIDRININPEKPRIMNIHPALLPAFPGTDGYGDTFRYGCKIAGCTVHFIDYGEDSGPIIDQRAFEIKPDDTLETIKQKGLKIEWELYPECIQLFTQNRLKIAGNKVNITAA